MALRFSGRLRAMRATRESLVSWIVLYSIILQMLSAYVIHLGFVILSEEHRFIHETMRTVEGSL
jgi:hypothetical protein